jgi:hypothetical protein
MTQSSKLAQRSSRQIVCDRWVGHWTTSAFLPLSSRLEWIKASTFLQRTKTVLRGYINYTESMIVWDSKTEESNDLVVDLFLASRNVVEQIGPWDRARLARPAAGNIRMTFLVADGLYFGEGPFEALAKDPIGGPVVAAATKLMQFLVMTARP